MFFHSPNIRKLEDMPFRGAVLNFHPADPPICHIHMKASLCEQTLDNACKAYPMLRGAILHSDRGTQYTSELYRKAINKYGILQSMNSAGG